MRRARHIGALVLAVGAQVAVFATPAGAYLTNADSTAADKILDGSTTAVKSPLADSTSVRTRFLYPTNRPKPTGGYPLIVYLHGTGEDRCADQSGISRLEMAAAGYVVLSFNQRGYPSILGPGWEATCAASPTEVDDGINDGGGDYGGPLDATDVSKLITWARDNLTWTGGLNPCSSACVNENKVGVIGFSQGGSRAMLMGVPSPGGTQNCSYAFDCRIKAIVPIAQGNRWTELANISSDGTSPRPHQWWETNWLPAFWLAGQQHTRQVGTFLEPHRARNMPKVNHTATMSGASDQLTVSAAPLFTPGDVGRRVLVPTAGSSNGTLAATINSINTGGTVATLSAASDSDGTATLPVSASWVSRSPSQNNSGSMSGGGTTVTVAGSPLFSQYDTGREIAVGGAGPNNTTLWSTITAVNSTGTVATVANTADSNGTASARVRWGAAANHDRRVIVDDDLAVSKVESWDVPTFIVNGWLDGNLGVYNTPSIEAFNRMPASGYAAITNAGLQADAAKYLYLGGCGHSPDPCKEIAGGPKTALNAAILRFFDRYVQENTSAYVRPAGTTNCATTGPCVLYAVPPKVTDTFSSHPWNTAYTMQTAPAWPPAGGSSTIVTNLHLGSPVNTMTTSTGGAEQTTDITNNLMAPPIYDTCKSNAYAPGEYVDYYWQNTSGADIKAVKFVADLWVSADEPRFQIYGDLSLMKADRSPLMRVWQGTAQILPTVVQSTPAEIGAPQRFVFQPGGAAITVGNGQYLMLRIATNNKNGSTPQQPIYTPHVRIYHDGSAHTSKFTITTITATT